jgi:hypothetical protein
VTTVILVPPLAIQIKTAVMANAKTYTKTAIIVMVAEMFALKLHQLAAMVIAARQRIVVSLMTSLLVLM